MVLIGLFYSAKMEDYFLILFVFSGLDVTHLPLISSFLCSIEIQWYTKRCRNVRYSSPLALFPVDDGDWLTFYSRIFKGREFPLIHLEISSFAEVALPW